MQKEVQQFEGDGISELFFELLWMKDALNFSPSICIPDTVIFKFGQPTQWYFTDSNGRIKRKNRQNLMNSRVEEVFTKQVLGYDVVATFISLPHDTKKINTDFKSIVEYLDRNSLNSLLYKRQKENHGILQRFIEPKSTHNEQIRAIWSPKICLIERTQNIHQLHDTRHGIYERCVTLEGPDYYVETAPLRGPVLAGQIQTLCETVISHITEVTYSQQNISRMVLTLKLDARDKMWLLYSSSIRLYDTLNTTTSTSTSILHTSKLVNINSVISLPQTIHLNPHKTFTKTAAKSTVFCVSCSCSILEDLRYPVTYKYIVGHYEQFLQQIYEDLKQRGDSIMIWPPTSRSAIRIIEICGNVGFGALNLVTSDDLLRKTSRLNLANNQGNEDLRIPLLLRYLHPRLSYTSYMGCRNDPLFMYKTASVCESCYLVYAEFATLVLRNGSVITRVMKPDPTSSEHSAPSFKRSNRPSSADWAAMSNNVHKSNSRLDDAVVDDHRRTIQKAIGLRSNDERIQPSLPPAISSPLGITGVITQLISSSDSALARSLSSYSPSVAPSTKAILDEKTIDTKIADRERLFFDQISKDPQLRDHHPLAHLVTSQQKLIHANISTESTQNHQRIQGMFGLEYGLQKGDKYDKYASYKQEIPYTINGMTIRPSKLKKLQKSMSFVRRDNKSPGGTAILSGKGGVDSAVVDHADFLDSTLASIEREFPNSL